MRGIVDRIEGNYAVCEIDGPQHQHQMRQIPVSMFDAMPADGDVIEIGEDIVTICREETAAKKTEIRSLFDRLKKK